MSNRDPDARYVSLEQALKFCFRQESKDIHTAIPGVVREYDPATKRASVQIALNMLVSNDGSRDNVDALPRGVVNNVPVLHPSGGGYVVHFPLQSGDAVMLIFSERGIERFKQGFVVSDPTLDALFEERDAVAVPGFGAMEIAPAGDGLCVQSESGDIFVHLHDGQVTIRAPGAVTIEGSTVTLRSSGETLVVR